MRLDKLLERLEYEVVQGSDEIEITTLVNDSRKVEEGSVFVCISGAVSDGHKYVPDVAGKGRGCGRRGKGRGSAGACDGHPGGGYKICACAHVSGVFRISGGETER